MYDMRKQDRCKTTLCPRKSELLPSEYLLKTPFQQPLQTIISSQKPSKNHFFPSNHRDNHPLSTFPKPLLQKHCQFFSKSPFGNVLSHDPVWCELEERVPLTLRYFSQSHSILISFGWWFLFQSATFQISRLSTQGAI